MSSGYFPLSRKYDDWGRRLVASIAGLKVIRGRLIEAAEELDVPEDALSVVMYLGEIRLAISLLEGLLEKEVGRE